MLLLAIPLGSILLVLAVSLLFIKRPASGTDWPSFVAMCLLFTTLVLAQWAWQYSKFIHGYGFYRISPENGAAYLAIIHVLELVIAIAFLWKHRRTEL